MIVVRRAAAYILRNLILLVNFSIRKKPFIFSYQETVKRIKQGRSIARFGDGEFSVMTGKRVNGIYQVYSLDLQKALLHAFSSRDPRLIIAISESLSLKKQYTPVARRHYRKFLGLFYPNVKRLLDFDYRYGNANITRFYMDFKKNNSLLAFCDQHIALMKSIWEGRNLLIAEGAGSRLGVGCDLFADANEIRRIICPSQNAFSSATAIKSAILRHARKDDLILMALGHTASVLCAEICIESNLQCIDIGHIDVEYIWMINRCMEKQAIRGKNFGEPTTGCVGVCDYSELKDYEGQIVERIE